MNSKLGAAIALAERGFYVFPLKINQKTPLFNNWQSEATKNIETIKSWWFSKSEKKEIPYNIGIFTGAYNCNQALVVVDVDDKEGKKGSDTLLSLELDGFEFTPSFCQSTVTGGQHIIYKHSQPLKQGTNKLGVGLDIRSLGGYIVAPGSVIDGKTYEIVNDFEIEDCPDWIVNRLSIADNPSKPKATNFDIDPETARKKATEYLTKEAPFAVQGAGGDETTFRVAARLKDFGCDVPLAFELMTDFWNENCSPPWDLTELQTKINNAFIYGKNEPGVNNPQKEFDVQQIDDEVKAGSSYIDAINKRFAIVFGDGKHEIMEETIFENGKPRLKFMPETTFLRLFSTKIIEIEGKKMSYASAWLNSSKRRSYKGLCFKPELEASNGYYNTWSGFAAPKTPYAQAEKDAQTGFDMFMEHTFKNICLENQEAFDWLITYFAHLIQRPFEKPLTTLVFKGRKGVGKNAFVDRIGNLIGQGHYVVAHDSRYLTSNFNGHFDRCLLLCLDEAFWSGDKSAEGKLKGLTTAPKIMIEKKGAEAYEIDNMLRIVIIGNEDWLAPASGDERRYTVLKVGEGRKKDNEFFKKMRILMDERGGNSILHDYLKTWDLSKANISQGLENEYLSEEKIESFGPFESFLYESLCDGRFQNSQLDDWQSRVNKDIFLLAYTNFCKSRNIKQWMITKSKISKKLKEYFPKINLDAREKKTRVYDFGELQECRDSFAKIMGLNKDWS